MDKVKIKLEYPLRYAALNALWNSISSSFGLCGWFADSISVEGNRYVFSWNGNEQAAKLMQIKQNECIRFQWEEDKGTDYFFEMRITMNELTGDVVLIISDFAEPADRDDIIMLWNRNIDQLKQRLRL